MKVIITGSTGMVGKGALLECLNNAEIDKVLVINRSTINIKHSKLEEILLKDFKNLSSIKDKLAGYDACFHCMGISALGLSEEKYSEITYTMTKELAEVLYKLNPQMVFSYISGAGTDGSEKGRVMWARVKGKTENMILNMGFKDAYAFRPGAILPEKGIKSRTGWYNAFYFIFRPLFPVMRRMKSVTTTTELGQVLINVSLNSSNKKVLENVDINALV
jgi:nucleoside-diphosphate-sugar epimerase